LIKPFELTDLLDRLETLLDIQWLYQPHTPEPHRQEPENAK
jgi:hypothetical protein